MSDTKTLSPSMLPTTKRPYNSNVPQKKPFVAKGHDAILKRMQDGGEMMDIVTSGDGTEHVGLVVARDKFTITLLLNETGMRRTFYKHAIESFGPSSQVL